MMSSFKIGKEYPRNEALRKLKRLQKSVHLFKGINLDGKRLVYYLRRFFQVDIIIGNGTRTSYKIISKNVTAYELDIPKVVLNHIKPKIEKAPAIFRLRLILVT